MRWQRREARPVELLRPMRAVLRDVAEKYHKEIADKIKIALEDETEMQELVQELESRGYFQICRYRRSFPIQLMETTGSREHKSWIRTTNGLMRINKELKRRTRVIGAFPSD